MDDTFSVRNLLIEKNIFKIREKEEEFPGSSSSENIHTRTDIIQKSLFSTFSRVFMCCDKTKMFSEKYVFILGDKES